jgi:hypothetical protein
MKLAGPRVRGLVLGPELLVQKLFLAFALSVDLILRRLWLSQHSNSKITPPPIGYSMFSEGIYNGKRSDR